MAGTRILNFTTYRPMLGIEQEIKLANPPPDLKHLAFPTFINLLYSQSKTKN